MLVTQEFIDREIKPKLHTPHPLTYNKGSSGDAGNTIEGLFHVIENNRGNSDIPEFEIKSKGSKDNNVPWSTFFNLEPTSFSGSQKKFIKKYGKIGSDDDPKTAYRFNHLVSYGDQNISGKGFYIDDDERQIIVRNTDRQQIKWNSEIFETHNKVYSDFMVCQWDIYKLIRKIELKIHNMALFTWHEISPNVIIIDKCDLYQNVDWVKFINEIKNGNIIIDFKMNLLLSDTIRNRGTAFRSNDTSLIKNIFRDHQIIC